MSNVLLRAVSLLVMMSVIALVAACGDGAPEPVAEGDGDDARTVTELVLAIGDDPTLEPAWLERYPSARSGGELAVRALGAP